MSEPKVHRSKLLLSGNPGKTDSRVIILKQIPHGFYEREMKQYFSQFGRVMRLRLAKSRKTGRSKGYAYVEFEEEGVAKVVADTMNNYLMYNKLLKCKLFKKQKLHRSLFKDFTKYFNKRRKIARERHNQNKTPAKLKKLRMVQLKRLRLLNGKLKSLGIDYSMSNVIGEQADENPALVQKKSLNTERTARKVFIKNHLKKEKKILR